MDILGIGPLELLFIVLIALIVLGPKDMVKAGKTIGRTLRTIVSSDTWRVVNQASREVRNLPNRLIREAGIDELQKQLPTQSDIRRDLGLEDVSKSIQTSTPKEFTPNPEGTAEADLSPWTTSPQTIAPPNIEQIKDAGGAGEDEVTPETSSASVDEEPDTEGSSETNHKQG